MISELLNLQVISKFTYNVITNELIDLFINKGNKFQIFEKQILLH